MENKPDDALPNLTRFANPAESALAVQEDPNEEKPAGAAELMTPDDAPGPEDDK